MKNANISITLPEDMLKHLDATCEAKGLKRSQVIELLLRVHQAKLGNDVELLPIYTVSLPDRQAYLTPDDIKALEKQGFTVTEDLAGGSNR